jgi:hypothetical protein
MYEFMKTKNGWRVFWGIDPYPDQTPEVEGDKEGTSEEADVLPFPSLEQEPENRPAA